MIDVNVWVLSARRYVMMKDHGVSTVSLDGSLWYAFDVFDDFGGTTPGSQSHRLYRLKDGQDPDGSGEVP